MKMGIKSKLVTFITITLLIVISLFCFISLIGIKNYQTKQNEAVLFSQKNLFEQYLNQYLSQQSNDSYTSNSNSKDFYLRRADMLNQPWLQAMPAVIYSIKSDTLSTIGKTSDDLSLSDKQQLMDYCNKGYVAYRESGDTIYYFSPLKYKNKTIAFLELQYSIKSSNELYKNIQKLFIIVGSISLLLGIILITFYFTKFTEDIHKITGSVENIKNGHFDRINILKRKDELGTLSMDISYMSSAIKKNLNDLEQEKDTLNIACEKLRKMDSEQKQFIGNVTHEFKTPITSIKAYADILQMYEHDENLINQASESISKECQRLTSMIDNILNLSSLEKYDFELNKTNVNLKVLFEQITSRMLGRIKKYNLNIETSLDDVVINADEENLRHIFINLIDNSIKYNKPGGFIRIKVCKNDAAAVIEISDTGIGIPNDELSRIFEPFYRIKNDRSRTSGGTGLGLALVKKLVEKQPGSISVQSEENIGSKFTICFPILDTN